MFDITHKRHSQSRTSTRIQILDEGKIRGRYRYYTKQRYEMTERKQNTKVHVYRWSQHGEYINCTALLSRSRQER